MRPLVVLLGIVAAWPGLSADGRGWFQSRCKWPGRGVSGGTRKGSASAQPMTPTILPAAVPREEAPAPLSASPACAPGLACGRTVHAVVGIAAVRFTRGEHEIA